MSVVNKALIRTKVLLIGSTLVVLTVPSAVKYDRPGVTKKSPLGNELGGEQRATLGLLVIVCRSSRTLGWVLRLRQARYLTNGPINGTIDGWTINQGFSAAD